MIAMIFYPVGIGKHIVCIDADQSAPYKQLVEANPKPHILQRCDPQKERSKLKTTIKQK